MRIESMARIGWLTLAAAGARGQEQRITVWLESPSAVPFTVRAQAQATAARIYAGIGVEVKWCSYRKAEFWVRLDTGLEVVGQPGAMGYAMPYGKAGTPIHVLFERLIEAFSQRTAGVVLGHVMAHELGHVLEGLSRHSDSGVMKARWDDHDFEQMVFRPLSFSAEDMEWIQAGVARATARSQASAPTIAARP
jgi:hypothetical protein